LNPLNFNIERFDSGRCQVDNKKRQDAEESQIAVNITVTGPDTDEAAPYIDEALKDGSDQLEELSEIVGTEVTIASIDTTGDDDGLSSGAITGIVIGVIVAVLIVGVILLYVYQQGAKDGKFEQV